MRRAADFLLEQPGPIPWQIPEGGRASFEPINLFLGQGANALEVAVATSPSRPNVSDVRQLWRRRKGGRPAPLLLVVLYSTPDGLEAATCGPVGEDPAVATDLDAGQVERIAQTALAEPNRNAATRFLTDALSAVDSELPGIRNVGMFATHELRYGVPRRPDWGEMSERGRSVLKEKGQQLVAALGFRVEQLGSATSVLRLEDSNQKAAVAVFLDETETPEGSSARFGSSSPVSHALAQADAERLPYVVLTRGSQIRVYSAEKYVGVGRKGRAETYIEANLSLLPDDLAGYLPLLFGADALRPGGTFQGVLERSRDFSTGLGERLRDRVYKEVVPQLAQIVARHSAVEFVAAQVEEWLSEGVAPSAIGIVARTRSHLEAVQAALDAAGIAWAEIGADGNKPGVAIGTMHRAKGLEFARMVVIAVNSDSVPLPFAVTSAAQDAVQHELDLLRERCLLYVACTRARDELVVTSSGTPSRLLPSS